MLHTCGIIIQKEYICKRMNDRTSEFCASSNMTKPKRVGHGYVFSISVGTIGEWSFFIRGRKIDSEGEWGWPFLKINTGILASKNLEINILAGVTRKKK